MSDEHTTTDDLLTARARIAALESVLRALVSDQLESDPATGFMRCQHCKRFSYPKGTPVKHAADCPVARARALLGAS